MHQSPAAATAERSEHLLDPDMWQMLRKVAQLLADHAPRAQAEPTHRTQTGPRRLDFGDLLRNHRRLAELTQEELAERAGLSTRSISALERGGPHVPRRATIALLARALGLSDPEQAELEGSFTRRRGPPGRR